MQTNLKPCFLPAVAAAATLTAGLALGQPNQGGFDDHQNMMDQLGIKTLRRGPDPNNQTTFDEATSNPFKDSMPDALTMKDGTKVTRAEQWPARRAEILEDFEREVYGRIPRNVPKVTWEVTATNQGVSGGIATVTRTLLGHVDNSGYTNITVNIQASFTVPAQATAPVPVMIEFGFGGFGFGGGARGGVRAGGGAPGTNAAALAGRFALTMEPAVISRLCRSCPTIQPARRARRPAVRARRARRSAPTRFTPSPPTSYPRRSWCTTRGSTSLTRTG